MNSTDERFPGARFPSQDTEVGLGLTLLLHSLQVPLAIATGFVSVIFIGVTQLLYLLPALVVALLVGRRGVAKGFAIGAATTLLFNLLSLGVVFVTLGGI